jgi:2-methylcitrate dehydratase PrpD
MGSRSGVSAVVMAQHGFTGVRDIQTGEQNVLEAPSTKRRRHSW